MHAGEEDHARPGWTTSIGWQNSPWKSQSEWQRTEINGESTSMAGMWSHHFLWDSGSGFSKNRTPTKAWARIQTPGTPTPHPWIELSKSLDTGGATSHSLIASSMTVCCSPPHAIPQSANCFSYWHHGSFPDCCCVFLHTLCRGRSKAVARGRGGRRGPKGWSGSGFLGRGQLASLPTS